MAICSPWIRKSWRLLSSTSATRSLKHPGDLNSHAPPAGVDDTKRVVTITRYLDTDLRFAEDGGLELQVQQQKKRRDKQAPGIKAEFPGPNRSKLPEIHVEASMSLNKGLSAPSERGKVLPWLPTHARHTLTLAWKRDMLGESCNFLLPTAATRSRARALRLAWSRD